jgi:hypothetical protein
MFVTSKNELAAKAGEKYIFSLILGTKATDSDEFVCIKDDKVYGNFDKVNILL